MIEWRQLLYSSFYLKVYLYLLQFFIITVIKKLSYHKNLKQKFFQSQMKTQQISIKSSLKIHQSQFKQSSIHRKLNNEENQKQNQQSTINQFQTGFKPSVPDLVERTNLQSYENNGQRTSNIIKPHQEIPHKNKQDQKFQNFFVRFKNYLTALPKKKKIILSLIMFATVSIVLLAILLPIFLTENIPNVQATDIVFNDISYSGNALQHSHQQDNHVSKVFISHKSKPHSVDLTFQSIISLLQSKTNQTMIEIEIPLNFLFENSKIKSILNQNFQNWLSKFNQNSRNFIDALKNKMYKILIEKGSYKNGKKIEDNIKLVSITQNTMVMLQYDPLTMKFKIGKFQAEKQHQTNTQVPVPTSQQKQQENISNSLDSIIWQIKRMVSRNIKALRLKSQQLIDYQKTLVSQNDIDQEWQTVLMTQCKALDHLKFRCYLDAIKTLVPQVSIQSLMENSTDYVLQHTLKLVFKEQ